ncbi:aminopeptidase N-like [Wyeomyia smithii]|uniref:aminopeptidase N-like n=1 Tax=Wyeomyia smithii TaxID=174621 RepID=UPI002467F24F|nr:aminopeptidase N-like [Wyeomyia smithii]
MWSLSVLLALLLAVSAYGGVPLPARHRLASVRQATAATGYRLPNTTLPLKYNVELTTHVHNSLIVTQFDFQGKVTIELQVLEENVQNITLHYRQITISHVTLTEITNPASEPIINDDSSFTTDTTFEFLTIQAPSVLKPLGTYLLEIQYSGNLRTDNGGFYRSSYTDENGDTKWIATTQFESTDARHAFPCYDEPGIRAPIGLKLTHGSAYHAVSNMPIKSSTGNNNYTTTEFEDTPPMQTYLLAFVVSDFAKVSDPANNQSVYAIPTAIANGDLNFALEAGVRVIQSLENLVGVNYSLPKLDQIAIPDFAAGAMENWGLVTYREEVLMYNETKSPMSQMKRSASIIGHEYAHQFFGNLVSPAWWSYLWLNEGFATFFQYAAAHQAYPKLRIDELFVIEAVQTAFQSDALESTRAMNWYVESPAAIAELFDDIAYQKAGSVLRQLQHAFGDLNFRTGLKYYLEARQMQAATPSDLSAALQRAVTDGSTLTLKVEDILNSWANQEGYPVLHVSRNETGILQLRQERYLLKESQTAAKATWYIPYNLASRQAADFSATLPAGWLTGETNEVHPTTQLNWTSDDWVIFNKQQTGYYRVNYDDNLWSLISHELREGDFKTIHHLNRAQLIDDSLNLARSGHIKYDIALELAQYLISETEFIPWASASNGLSYLNLMLSSSSKYDQFKKYVWSLIEPAFKTYGLTGKAEESHFDKLTRSTLVNWACLVDSEECLTATSALLADVVSNKTADVDPNIKSLVYCHGLRDADRDTFLFVLDRMQRSQDSAERSQLLGSLGCPQDAVLLRTFLETSLDETVGTNYRGQERTRVLSSVVNGGKVGLEIAMEFLEANVAAIDRLYNQFGGRAVGSAVIGMAGRIVSQEQNEKFETLLGKLRAGNYLSDDEESTAKEISGENLLWTNKYLAGLERWLEDNVGSGSMVLRGDYRLFSVLGAAVAVVSYLKL